MQKDKVVPVYQKSLLSWIFSGNLKIQGLLILIILATVSIRVVPLEMQKRIINQAISLKQIHLLFIYCGIYIAAVLTTSGLKFTINVFQTKIAQRATADMRKALYAHVLTLPLGFFRKTQPGMVVSSLVTELATAGDFIGMAVAVPITNILTLLAFTVYLFWLNSLLAAVSLVIYPLVLLIVPTLQKKANIVNKGRVDITRRLSSKIAETVAGVHEIHGHGTYAIENKKFADLVNELEIKRVVWNLYRFGIKIANNFFTNLSPFVIFILGGYLAIHGQLALGALVAFLSAQEKIFDPWRELIDFYQAYQDASVSYYQTMGYFAAVPDHVLEPVGRKPFDLRADLDVKDLSFVTEEGIRLLDNVNFSLKPGQHMALVGFSGSGKSTLAHCICQLHKYTNGHVRIDGKEVSELTKRDMIQNLGFVSQTPFIFEGTIEENLRYALAALYESNGDRPAVPVPTLDDMINVLQQAGLFIDVLRFGLNTVLLGDAHEQLEATILRLRHAFQKDYGASLAEYVEFYVEAEYLPHTSIAGNLIFGAPLSDAFEQKNLQKNPFILKLLNKTGLYQPLLLLSRDICRRMIDILGALQPDDLFFEQCPIEPEELDTFRQISRRLEETAPGELSASDQAGLMALVLRFAPGRHKIVAMPETLREQVLGARPVFKENIQRDFPDAIVFHQLDRYIYSQTILNNIFFGKSKTGHPLVQEKIYESIIQLLIEADLLETILEIGLRYPVGTKGDNLSGGQRQKLAIARVFLKAPKILVLDEATSALDNNSQARIQNLLETRWKGKTTVVSVVHRLDIIKNYDVVAVMKSGKIGEMGRYEALMATKGLLHQLVSGRR